MQDLAHHLVELLYGKRLLEGPQGTKPPGKREKVQRAHSPGDGNDLDLGKLLTQGLNGFQALLFWEDVSEVLACYALGVYKTQSNPQANRVIA